MGLANGARIGHVARHGHGRSAEEAHQTVEAHRVQVHERDLRAILEQDAHGGVAERAGRAGHHRDAVLEVHARLFTISIALTFSCASIIEATRRSPNPSATACS